MFVYLFREKQVALEEILSTNKTVLEMQQREKALKEQLNLYISKYEEFQSSLKQSSGIFNSYKLEIEKVNHVNKILITLSLHSNTYLVCFRWQRKLRLWKENVMNLASSMKSAIKHYWRWQQTNKSKTNMSLKALVKLLNCKNCAERFRFVINSTGNISFLF